MLENAEFVFIETFRFGDNFTPLAALTIKHLQKAMKMLSYFSKYFFCACQIIFVPLQSNMSLPLWQNKCCGTIIV